jgi:hypothetical protein
MAIDLAEGRAPREMTEDREEEVFELGQESETEEAFKYDDETPNLVTIFKEKEEGRQALKRIAMKVIEDQRQSFEATEKHRQMMAETWKLFTGQIEKSEMFQGLSKAHVPILLENTIRMVYRQQYELFGNWTQVFGVTPIGPDDEKIAKLLTLHGNWQIRKKIKNFKREIGYRGLMIFDLFGDFAVHSYWDPVRRCNNHEVLTAEDFGCAYAHVSTMPDYSDVPWRWKMLRLDASDLRKKAPYWEDVDTTISREPPGWASEQDTLLADEVEKSVGLDKTSFLRGQYLLIQYEGWLNLPGQKKDRFCQVIVDTATHTVLSLRIYERPDPYDRKRFELQQQQKQDWMQAMMEYQQTLELQEQVTQQAMEAALMSPDPGQGATQAVMAARQLEQMPPPAPPPMPDWMGGDPEAEPEEPLFTPIHMFTHFVNIEPIMGTIGMGTGKLHADQNLIANAGAQAFIDQAFFANFRTFLARGDVQFEDGKIKIQPGAVNRVIGSSDITKDIQALDFGQANPQLLNLVQMMTEFGNRVSNTPEVLSGEAGKSGETAQGLAARLEQATKMLSVPTGKYADGVTQVLINNATLNAMFMPEEEMFFVNNHDPSISHLGWQHFKVLREMYDRPYDVEISADLKFVSTAQRIAEADALVQLPKAVPALEQNLAFQRYAIVKSLEARSRYDLIPLLGGEPPVPEVFGMPSFPPPPPQPGAPGAGGPPVPQQGGGQQPADGPAGPQQRGTPKQ